MNVTREIKRGDHVSRVRAKGSKEEIEIKDLETERRRDVVFSNLLLCRHHRSLADADGNEHYGIIVASRASSLLFDDEGILCEILSRLPVRSILRFKSVCKRWLSLIKHNAYFINLHFTRSQSRPNILFITPSQKKIDGGDGYWYQPNKTPRQCIFLADISSVLEGSSSSSFNSGEPKEAIIRNVRMTADDDWFVYDLVLKPVNGLVCFVDREAAAVRIYNVSTREETQWIKSTLIEEEKNRYAKEDGTIEINHWFPIYQFGFDPRTMQHKVFCFWRLSTTQSFLGRTCESQSYASWEALTVGHDTKWRRISVVASDDNKMNLDEVVPQLDMGSCRVYANGIIYWLMNSMNHGDIYDTEVIVAFDVGSEKYRVIPIPNFILDEPREKSFFSPIAMLELNGRVALTYRMSPFHLKLWILDDGADKKIENCHGNDRNWSAESVKLPFHCYPSFVNFHAVEGTDQIVFECYDDLQRNLKSVSLYSYDRNKKTLTKIKIDGISLFPLHYSRSVFTTFTESLFLLH
ncbi:hypothetical protein MKW98_029814 [Papaver atlanticum]|uniref:F-box domain-containing protein n=1 Tax=Papaver atlanticum TaxID=357466 RepID=A0AAD4TJJ9_9MAGN|nr:hypothetical protein MKW98_029814 [Papaver atlanticum]